MARFALICPPFLSHVRVFEALAGALDARGHETVFVLNAGAERLVEAGRPACAAGAAAGLDLAAVTRRAARPNGLAGILRTVADTAALTDALCRDGPAILGDLGVDAVVADQMEPAGGLLAARLGLPFVSVAAALPVEAAPGVPPPYLGWFFDPSERGLKRNRGGARVAALLLRRQRQTIEAWSERFGLARRSTLEDCLSSSLRLSQTVAGFDFPRPPSPIAHALGPIRRTGAATGPLFFEPDPARPFVFASLGTLQGHRLGLFRKIAAACRSVGAQLLLAHCGGLSEADARSIEADRVVSFAPQAAVLARADVCVTHGGLNTVMDALQAGVPQLAIPLAFDQPGVAARIHHHGTGLRCDRVLLSSRAIASSLDALLASSAYRERAIAIGREIAASGGAELGAVLIERTILGRASGG